MITHLPISSRQQGHRTPIYTVYFGEVAQLAEQRTHKPWVAGSSPALATDEHSGKPGCF